MAVGQECTGQRAVQILPKYVNSEFTNEHFDVNAMSNHSDSDTALSVTDYSVSNDDKPHIISHARHEFFNGRQILIGHLPRDTTEQEIRDLLLDFELRLVTVETSKHYAKVLPAKVEDYEPIMAKLQVSCIKEQKVSVLLSQYLLCVAHLPPDCTQEEFKKLVAMSGTVCRCFLMPSSITGKSKGYGFVEYTTKEAANKVMTALDGWRFRTCTLHCDWLNNGHLTFDSLQSRCLFVDQLPGDYEDSVEFRKIFSKVAEPTYCQIAMKSGTSMGVGLVEFATAEEAEKTQEVLTGTKIKQSAICVSFCIPGVSAAMMYGKLLMSNTHGIQRGALLPDPVPKPSRQIEASQLLNAANTPQATKQALLNILQKHGATKTTQNNKPNMLLNTNGNCAYVAPVLPPQLHNPLLQGTAAALPQMPTLLHQQQLPASIAQQHRASIPGQLGDVLMNSAIHQVQSSAKPLQPSQQVNKQNGVSKAHLIKSQVAAPAGMVLPSSVIVGATHLPNVSNANVPVLSPGQAEVQQSAGGNLEEIIAAQQAVISALLQQQSNSAINSNIMKPIHLPGIAHQLTGYPAPAAAAGFVNTNIPTLTTGQPFLGQSVNRLHSLSQVPNPTCFSPTLHGLPSSDNVQHGPVNGVETLAFLNGNQLLAHANGIVPSGSAYTSVAQIPGHLASAVSTSSSQSLTDAHKLLLNLTAGSANAQEKGLNQAIIQNTLSMAQTNGVKGTMEQNHLIEQNANPSAYDQYSAFKVQTMLDSPAGQKRKHPVPSPEPSPQGLYIGQHSQGIGGHYAESALVKRRRLMTGSLYQ